MVDHHTPVLWFKGERCAKSPKFVEKSVMDMGEEVDSIQSEPPKEVAGTLGAIVSDAVKVSLKDRFSCEGNGDTMKE